MRLNNPTLLLSLSFSPSPSPSLCPRPSLPQLSKTLGTIFCIIRQPESRTRESSESSGWAPRCKQNQYTSSHSSPRPSPLQPTQHRLLQGSWPEHCNNFSTPCNCETNSPRPKIKSPKKQTTENIVMASRKTDTLKYFAVAARIREPNVLKPRFPAQKPGSANHCKHKLALEDQAQCYGSAVTVKGSKGTEQTV